MIPVRWQLFHSFSTPVLFKTQLLFQLGANHFLFFFTHFQHYNSRQTCWPQDYVFLGKFGILSSFGLFYMCVCVWVQLVSA